MYLLYFSMRRPPRTTTLFPYTTLFRSKAARWGGRCHHLGVEILEPQTRAQRQTIGDMPRVLHVEPEVGIQPVGVERRDRKSTRLNSSHLVISYAVFCLKKKK